MTPPETPTAPLFRIGDFARLGGVSVRTLHHYETLGLLRPAAHSEAGVRHYAPGQLATLRRITGLKTLGFALGEIGALLSDPAREPYAAFLRRKRSELTDRRSALDTQLARLETELATEERMNEYTVHLRPLAGLPVLTATGTAPDYRHVTAPMNALYDRVCAVMAAQHVLDPGWSVVTWRGGGYGSEDTIELEVAFPLVAGVPEASAPGVSVQQHPPLLVASTVHLGSYERFGEAYAAVLAWMDRHGYAPAGPVREVYLRFGATDADHISEVQVPVQKT